MKKKLQHTLKERATAKIMYAYVCGIDNERATLCKGQQKAAAKKKDITFSL